MNQIKIYCTENPPFNSANNIQTFDWMGGVYDIDSSYVNLYVSVMEDYSGNIGTFPNIGNGISNSEASDIMLGDVYFRNIRFVDSNSSEDIYFVQNVNVYNSVFNIFRYNSNEQDLQKYLAGDEVTNIDPSNLNPQTAYVSSFFRELYNEGTVLSKRFTATTRIPLNKLLGNMKLSDFRNRTMRVILDFDTSFPDIATEKKPSYLYNSTIVGGTNALTYASLGGANIAGQFTAGANDANVFTLTAGQNILGSTFPFGVNDTLAFTTAGNRTIVNFGDYDANGYLTTITVGGNAVANIPANDTLLNTSVPVRKVIYFANPLATVNNYNINVGSQVGVLTNAGANVSNANLSFLLTGFISSTNNLACVGLLDGEMAGGNPFGANNLPICSGVFFASGGGNANIPAGTNITSSIDHWDKNNFDIWTGAPVLIYGSANVTKTNGLLTSIAYGDNGATIQIDQPITVQGGNAGVLFMTSIATSALDVTYPKKSEMVLMKMANDSVKNMNFIKQYKKTIAMGAVIPVLPANSLYEVSFELPVNTLVAVISICNQNQLLPNLTYFTSYRVLLDGKDTTNRPIILSSNNKSMMNDKLINGFQYIDEELDNIGLSSNSSMFSNDNINYPIIQDVMPDGKQHGLTLQLNVGTAITTAMNLYLFCKVLSEMS